MSISADRGLLVPPAIRDRHEPAEIPCCYGSANAENRCTCWEPVYDLEQQPLHNDGALPVEISTRAKCCGDCAYRNGSPERSDERAELLLDVAHSGGRREFWCHQGVRRVIAFKHPDGRELPAGDGDYRPPVGPEDRPIIWKADGTPGERCAGWAALAGAASRQSAANETQSSHFSQPQPRTSGILNRLAPLASIDRTPPHSGESGDRTGDPEPHRTAPRRTEAASKRRNQDARRAPGETQTGCPLDTCERLHCGADDCTCPPCICPRCTTRARRARLELRPLTTPARAAELDALTAELDRKADQVEQLGLDLLPSWGGEAA